MDIELGDRENWRQLPKVAYGAPMKILVLPGDGIGPEITVATLAVLGAMSDAHHLGLTFEMMEIGFASLAAEGSTCPDKVLARVPQVDGVILGPFSGVWPPETISAASLQT